MTMAVILHNHNHSINPLGGDIMPATKHEISLPQAAQRLRIPWRAAWEKIMTGAIEGEYRGGRWYIDARSVERVAAERDHETTAA